MSALDEALPQDVLRAVLDNIGNGITVVDPDGRFVFVNEGAAQTLGFASAKELRRASAAEVMGRYDVLDPEGRPLDPAQLPNRLAQRGQGSPWTVVGFRLRGTSEERWALMRSTPVVREGQRPLTVNVFHDITAQRRGELSARFLAQASNRLGRSLTDYAATLAEVARLAVPSFADWCAVDLAAGPAALQRVAVAHVDPAKIQFAYELEQRYPTPMDETNATLRVIRTGKSELFEDIPPELIEQGARDAEHLRLIRALQLRSAIVVPMPGRRGVLGAITFVWAESGRLYGKSDLELAEDLGRRAGLAVDNARLYDEVRTLSTTLEKRVEERTAELQEANRELESFSYSVSHDLRAPVRHVAGFVELLEKHTHGTLDERSRHYVETIRQAAKRAGELVDGLLSFSRMGRAALNLHPVDLQQVVNEIRNELEPELQGRSVEFAVGALPTVPADASLVRVVFHNLIQNAVKFTSKKPEARIEIGAAKQGRELVFTVRDNGAGFDPRYMDKLFGVFQRLHAPEEYEGTGIGLATVRRIVTKHGGRIWAEGTPGAGAAFHFTLAPSEARS